MARELQRHMVVSNGHVGVEALTRTQQTRGAGGRIGQSRSVVAQTPERIWTMQVGGKAPIEYNHWQGFVSIDALVPLGSGPAEEIAAT